MKIKIKYNNDFSDSWEDGLLIGIENGYGHIISTNNHFGKVHMSNIMSNDKDYCVIPD